MDVTGVIQPQSNASVTSDLKYHSEGELEDTDDLNEDSVIESITRKLEDSDLHNSLLSTCIKTSLSANNRNYRQKSPISKRTQSRSDKETRDKDVLKKDTYDNRQRRSRSPRRERGNSTGNRTQRRSDKDALKKDSYDSTRRRDRSPRRDRKSPLWLGRKRSHSPRESKEKDLWKKDCSDNKQRRLRNGSPRRESTSMKSDPSTEDINAKVEVPSADVSKQDEPDVHRRADRCRTCERCKLPDCGRCIACKDMVKFGGNGTLGMPCIECWCLQINPYCIQEYQVLQIRRMMRAEGQNGEGMEGVRIKLPDIDENRGKATCGVCYTCKLPCCGKCTLCQVNAITKKEGWNVLPFQCNLNPCLLYSCCRFTREQLSLLQKIEKMELDRLQRNLEESIREQNKSLQSSNPSLIVVEKREVITKISEIENIDKTAAAVIQEKTNNSNGKSSSNSGQSTVSKLDPHPDHPNCLMCMKSCLCDYHSERPLESKNDPHPDHPNCSKCSVSCLCDYHSERPLESKLDSHPDHPNCLKCRKYCMCDYHSERPLESKNDAHPDHPNCKKCRLYNLCDYHSEQKYKKRKEQDKKLDVHPDHPNCSKCTKSHLCDYHKRRKKQNDKTPDMSRERSTSTRSRTSSHSDRSSVPKEAYNGTQNSEQQNCPYPTPTEPIKPPDPPYEVSLLPTNIILVRNLDCNIADQVICEKIKSVCPIPVVNMKVHRNPVTQLSTGVCSVEVHNPVIAVMMYDILDKNKLVIDGKQVMVSYGKVSEMNSPPNIASESIQQSNQVSQKDHQSMHKNTTVQITPEIEDTLKRAVAFIQEKTANSNSLTSINSDRSSVPKHNDHPKCRCRNSHLCDFHAEKKFVTSTRLLEKRASEYSTAGVLSIGEAHPDYIRLILPEDGGGVDLKSIITPAKIEDKSYDILETAASFIQEKATNSNSQTSSNSSQSSVPKEKNINDVGWSINTSTVEGRCPSDAELFFWNKSRRVGLSELPSIDWSKTLSYFLSHPNSASFNPLEVPQILLPLIPTDFQLTTDNEISLKAWGTMAHGLLATRSTLMASVQQLQKLSSCYPALANELPEILDCLQPADKTVVDMIQVSAAQFISATNKDRNTVLQALHDEPLQKELVSIPPSNTLLFNIEYVERAGLSNTESNS